MDMTIFQIESNKVLPKQGSFLISAPYLKDYHFSRSVVLLVEHGEEGSMGIVLNKHFHYLLTLNDLVPELEFTPRIPVFKGGPVSRETLFYLHRLKDLKGALPLGNGLYLNGDFEQMKRYILEGNPTQGVVRFFSGYAGWQGEQLLQEIEENSWMVSNRLSMDLLHPMQKDLWKNSLTELGGKYALWARYPKYPTLN